jgi:hypothetical protein
MTANPPQSADICQRLLRGYQFSPSDQTQDELANLYTILDQHFDWFHAHQAAAGYTLVRDMNITLIAS